MGLGIFLKPWRTQSWLMSDSRTQKIAKYERKDGNSTCRYRKSHYGRLDTSYEIPKLALGFDGFREDNSFVRVQTLTIDS